MRSLSISGDPQKLLRQMDSLSWKIFFIMLLFTISACAHPISFELRAQIDRNLTLTQIVKSPDPQLEKFVMFGGVIVKTRTFTNRTELEVIQKNLDSFGYPSRDDKTEGRFIFIKEGFLEPEIYAKGRYVTGAGKITGNRAGKIDSKEYSYPLIEVSELKLWEEDSNNVYYGGYYAPFYRPYPFYGYGGFGRFRSFGVFRRFYGY